VLVLIQVMVQVLYSLFISYNIKTKKESGLNYSSVKLYNTLKAFGTNAYNFKTNNETTKDSNNIHKLFSFLLFFSLNTDKRQRLSQILALILFKFGYIF